MMKYLLNSTGSPVVRERFFNFYLTAGCALPTIEDMNEKKWEPLEQGKLDKINSLFLKTYPESEYGSLGRDISNYWIGLLRESWDDKDEDLRRLDLDYNPSDPLSRVEQKTTVIAYADSIKREGEKSLETLDRFFKTWLPAVGGLHILPACTVVEDRFNDGYFSQVERNNIHSAFGSNELFADIVKRYFSMNDIVLGHVDIENPVFQEYLQGHDKAGLKFYTFTMEEYESLKAAGSFDKVFRPRPFPLFTIFRRLPVEMPYRSLSHSGRVDVMIKLIKKMRGITLEHPVINILWLFNKIKNDQMLLDEDYRFITEFIEWIENKGINRKEIFTESMTQEVQHVPYIFVPGIDNEECLLEACGFTPPQAEAAASIFRETNMRLFGEEIRALTTFSHVQVDVNTTTFEGLKALACDLVFYLKKDLNMLRLDAVNYAFKKWGTSCFGLPELDSLMKIIYLSMECISPRMIPNLEVNDSLTTILNQMTSGSAPPPMMHDFFLASLLPAVFHSGKPEIIGRIFSKIKEYNPPHDSIRFSLSESHDGKSVRGSLDLLTFEERMVLTRAVTENGGYVKYKSIPAGSCPVVEFEQFCRETGFDAETLQASIFTDSGDGMLYLKPELKSIGDINSVVPELSRGAGETLQFFFTRIIDGRDPYELCISTRDSLPALFDEELELNRFLAFETLAFAIMGRNVKTIYFNDLLALPNDYKRVKVTGELRNIKRTKVNYDELLSKLEFKKSFEARLVKRMNNLIALVDSDPALHFRGEEACLIQAPEGVPVALIGNRCGEARSLCAVNLSGDTVNLLIDPVDAGFSDASSVIDNISGREFDMIDGKINIIMEPYARMWLSLEAVAVPAEKLV
ncbi:MAG: hypothetical protein PQJ61_01060 [Spirochaetales bacterium]|uniref:Uncharacterized protein n=1 Tax=Candidatus Thalassospirochaeta sargassi TaxID=3119039 RepID=A0AAJ1MHJ2_9SPIO|nr:hypothetical protein [Spirochaetales bacterium]